MKWKKYLTAFGLIFLVGCATRYHNTSFSGGFSEKQLSRNEFFVAFSGNGYTSGQRATDLCLLRCAEITLEHGFHYFVLTSNKAEYDRSTAVSTGSYIPTGYGGVFLSSTQVIPKPNTANRIVCFRDQPATITDYFDAQKLFQELSKKYGIKKEIQNFPKSNLNMRFKPMSDLKCDFPVTEGSVTVFDQTRLTVAAFPIAEYEDYESPVESNDELKRYLVAAVVKAGANGVHILKSHYQVMEFNPNADKRVGFMCALLVIPKTKLGIQFESGTGYENRRVIRRIQNPEATATGLRIGDNVLAMNGIDIVRDADAWKRDYLKWEVDQVVQVTVARDGQEITLPIKTIANQP